MPAIHRKHRLSSEQVILLGFALVILTGAWLLTLPIASRSGERTPFLNALFTSTSAVCVTGLVLYDTASHWTLFGQIVIITLIQIGGMGVITVALTITMLSGKKITLMQRSVMQGSISAPQVGGIVRFTRFIVRGIFIIELCGAVLLSTVFIPDFGTAKGIWMSIFHSVSAFCNAGFDLLGTKHPFSSLSAYADNIVINLVIAFLIIIGGLGFLTWEDICRNRFHFSQYRTQSKVILTATACLIFFPALYFFFFEFSDLPVKTRILGSFFQSVTTRTAGFNTLDLNSISETGQMLMSMLMITGGAPGSTAGGMKNTTLFVLLACAAAIFKKQENGHLFGRRISDEVVKNAATVFLLYVGLFILGGMAISRIEALPIVDCLFESASAMGTVGLTLGHTPDFGTASKIILMCQMYFGRVGSLTLIFATMPAAKVTLSKYPLDKITVG
ncbi:MAG: TrkH family potassium uptake protein [Candidatus Limivicinus sp.]